MRKFNLLMIATMVAFGALFTSCSKDDEAEAPLIETFTADNTSIAPGSTVTFSIKVRPGSDKIENLVIMRDDTPAYDIAGNFWSGLDATGQKGYINSSDIYTANPGFKCTNAGTVTFTATAYDENGLASTPVTVTVEVKTGGTVISTLKSEISTTITTSSNDGTFNSACASASGSIYAPVDVLTAQESLIDFVYFNGSNKTPYFYPATTIYSPSEASGMVAIKSPYQNWATLNATKFVSASATDYTNATYSSVNTLATGATNSKTGVLSNGSVYAFKTAAGKVGIFKVTNIANADLFTTESTITISIKVQE